jgi:hypothetical protein
MGSLPAGAGCVLIKEQLELEAGGGLLVNRIVDMPHGQVVGRVVLDDKGSDGGRYSLRDGRRDGRRYGRHYDRHNSGGDLGGKHIPLFQGGTRRAVMAAGRVMPNDEGIVGRIPLFQGETRRAVKAAGRVVPDNERIVGGRIPLVQGETRRAVMAAGHVMPDDEGIVGRIPLSGGNAAHGEGGGPRLARQREDRRRAHPPFSGGGIACARDIVASACHTKKVYKKARAVASVSHTLNRDN